MKDETVDARAHALPFIGGGEIPEHRDRSVAEDEHTFLAIVTLFLRSWPFIRPQVMGNWWRPGQGVEQSVAEDIGGGDYHFFYAPILLLVVAFAGPMLGMMPATADLQWQHYTLYGLITVVIAGFSYLTYIPGRYQFQSALLLVFLVFAANFEATVVIDGYLDGFYMAAITLACLMGWMVQFRTRAAQVDSPCAILPVSLPEICSTTSTVFPISSWVSSIFWRAVSIG